MKTVIIDGVEYEDLEDPCRVNSMNGDVVLYLRPLPPKQKTRVQVAAEVSGCEEDLYRSQVGRVALIYDAIEQRLQAIEAKVEK